MIVAESQVMMIQIHCSCGQLLQVDSNLAGQRALCQSCGYRHTVPLPTQLDDGAAIGLETGEELQAGAFGPVRKRNPIWLPPIMAALAILLLSLTLIWALLGPTDGGMRAAAGGTGVGSGSGLGAGDKGDGGGAVTEGEDEGAGKTVENKGADDDRRVTLAAASDGKEPKPAGHDGGKSQAAAVAKSDQPATQVRPQELPAMGFRADIKKQETKVPFKAKGSKKSSASASSGKAGREGEGSIFDYKGHGTKFVYVIDFSSSMIGDRFEAAKTELIRSIEGLTESKKFYVIFYDHLEEPMPGRNVLRSASENTKRRAINWIRSMGTRGGTDPTAAMQHAIQLSPDAIFLLTDGGFDPSVHDAIKAANRKKKVAINTIAFHDPSGEAILKQIAKENRGDYRFVPSPSGFPNQWYGDSQQETLKKLLEIVNP